MRTLPLHCGTIQVASATGELRRIKVSGLAKARLLWLFRNFRVLDFPVLSKKQRQLIVRVWNAGTSAAPANAPLDVIGRIEGFSPQLFQSRIQSRAPATARKSTQPREPFRLPNGPLLPIIRGVLSGLLLGSAVYLGPRLLPPKHPVGPHTQAAVVAHANVRSDPRPPARTSAEPARPAADPPAPTASARVVPAFHPPNAMAQNASSPEATPPLPHPQSTVGSGLPQKTEVIIRVTVNRAGHAQDLQIMRGDGKKNSEALHAARFWNFQPCPSSAGCEHILKFTEHGDASTVQVID